MSMFGRQKNRASLLYFLRIEYEKLVVAIQLAFTYFLLFIKIFFMPIRQLFYL